MLIGYARVSTQLQDNATQIDALKKSGCATIFEEKMSGGRWDRPKLQELLKHIRKGVFYPHFFRPQLVVS